jgi:glutamate racemase
VALAEEGMVNNAIAREALQYYLSEFQQEDTLLLGCTHFPVFKPLLATLLPATVSIVDSAEATALSVLQLLQTSHLMNNNIQPKEIRYLVTDSVPRFQHVGEIFLGEPVLADEIELVDACLIQSGRLN